MGKDGDPSGMKPGDLEAARPSSRLDSGDPRMQVARVLLPDGTHKEFALNRTSDGEALFRLVTADLSIEEREYFSLCFYEKTEGGRHWLYNDKKIAKQLKGLPWEFSFEVKFYPTTPTTLNDDHARYYVFLQLRRDILSGRLAASVATHAILGSYVAQAEFGDSPQTINEQYENFLRTARIVPDPNPEVLTKVVEFHKELRGRTASEVENLYLDTCKQLSLYGIHLFPAKDKNDDDVRVGVGSAGIYCLKSNSRESRFGWQNIVKISYRRSYFLVKLKPGEVDKNEAVVSYRLSDYLHAKRVWKCAVEHHTFFRLIQPEDKPKQSFFNFGSTRFRYHGRTQFQTKMASQMFDKPSTVERIQSSRASHSLENVARQPLTPLHYTDSELEQNKMASPAMSYNIDSRSPSKKQHDEKRDKKGKQSRKGKNETNSSESSDSDDEKRRFAVITSEESGQPHTTVSSWQENSELPEQVVTDYDEHGNKITRTIRTSQVKHTVQKQTFQNYIVDDDQNPVGVVQVERSREQLTPVGQEAKNGYGVAESHTRTMTYDANGGDDAWGGQGLGEFVSSKTVTQGNRTIETITYKVEKDGIIETRVEHRVTIHSDAAIDHDSELSQAILEATQMNPDMTVEKIEVRQETTN